MANDVQLLSHGRLLLGLGSQIKPHIEKRYSMPWSHPAPRMREYVLAMRAIWACWNEGVALNFRGEFYKPHAHVAVLQSRSEPLRRAEGLSGGRGRAHDRGRRRSRRWSLGPPFHDERYIREVTLPALERGLAKSGREAEDFPISFSGLHRDRRHRTRDRRRHAARPGPDRVLRFDAGLSRRARAARLGRPAERTEHALEDGASGTRWAS